MFGERTERSQSIGFHPNWSALDSGSFPPEHLCAIHAGNLGDVWICAWALGVPALLGGDDRSMWAQG